MGGVIGGIVFQTLYSPSLLYVPIHPDAVFPDGVTITLIISHSKSLEGMNHISYPPLI